MLIHEMRTASKTTTYHHDHRGGSLSPSPVRPPRRTKDVTVGQMNQMLDEVKQEQEKKVVIDTLAALVTDVNATAQVLRRSVSRSKLENVDQEHSFSEHLRSDSTMERPSSSAGAKPTAEVEYHLLINSPAHMDYSDGAYSPYLQRKPTWDNETCRSERYYPNYGSRERSIRARSETPTRKIIVLEEPTKCEKPVCAACKGFIEGACITALAPNSARAQKYHPAHFVCSYCVKPLNLKGTYREHQRKPYCHDCFYRLYSGHIYETTSKI